MVYPGEDTLTVYTDGSSYSRPRRGGIGFRFVWTGDDGHEVHHDSEVAGYREATNNQMELQAVIVALREVHAPWSPVPLSEFRKIDVLTDSDYLVSGYQSALFRWPRDRWMTSAGSPVENADLWQELAKAVRTTGKRVEFTWTPGRKGTHAKAVDKLAKRSALGHLNGPLSPTRVRRSRSPQQVSRGSVPIGGQTMRIYIRTDKWMPVQRCFRYRYEVCDDGPLEGLVDDMYSDRSIMLSAGHEYLVRVNDDPGHPQVVEVIEEITTPVADDQSG